MLWKEIAIGFLLAGFIGLLGNDFFNVLFITDAPPLLRTIENVLVGPLIAILSFVCSVGNVPLAAVLWSGGIGFAGVIAFIFADLIVIPIVLAYRKYYGTAFALRITALMFVTIVIAALIVDGALRPRRADPDRPPPHPHRHLRHDRGQLQALPQHLRHGDLPRPLLAHPRRRPAQPHCEHHAAAARVTDSGYARGIGSGPVPLGEAEPDIQSQSGASSVSYQGATKRYGDSGAAAVDHLTLEVPAGEICVLVGPSGCGKTTAMRMVNRMVEISEGDILIGGESVRDREPAQLRREIGYVIQEIGLFPHRTIAENIAAVPQLLGWKKDRTRARTAELLELIGLDPELGERYPAQLSGGQQQRVGVARALAADPLVMLMDEPFGAIDPINRERLQNEFLRLQAEIRKTVLFVTHDIDEAIKMGDRIAILREGGRLEQYATPAEMLMAPATEFVEDFVGADRALKRLALMRVADINLWEAPLAYVGQPTAEVRAKLDEPRRRSPLPAAGRRRAAAAGLALRARPAGRDACRPGPTRRWGRCWTATTSCATRSPTCSRARPSTPPVVDHRGRIDGVLSVEIISEFLASPEAKTEEHSAVERPPAWLASALPLAAAGAGRRRLLQRTHRRQLPCQAQAQPPLLLGLGAGTHRPLRDADAAAARTGRDLGRDRLRRSPSPSPCSPTAAAGCGRRCWPGPGSSTRSPASPSSSCCCRSPAAAARRRSSPSAPTRCRSSTATSPSASTTSPSRPRTRPAAWG